MKFDILTDEHGVPYHVNTDDGFMQCSRPFNKEEDGWMLNQLSSNDFTAVSLGRQTEWLIREVNRLRRDVFDLNRECKQWRAAAGYPTNSTESKL